MNKENIGIGLFASNVFLALGIIFVAVELIAPLFDGKLFVIAIIRYASWIIVSLLSKKMLKLLQEGQRIRAYFYALVCLGSIANLVLWFSYPINIILSVLSIIMIVFSYRAHVKRMKNSLPIDDHYKGR